MDSAAPLADGCYSDRYIDALAFVADRHRDQRRKTSATGVPAAPYVTHLMRVSATIWAAGGTEDQAIAGLCHDVVEDTDTTLPELAARFGPTVARYVDLCTDADPANGEGKAPWRPRKELHFAHLQLPDVDPDGFLVVAADKIDNLESVISDARAALNPAGVWAAFKGGFYGTVWYLRTIRDTIAPHLADTPILARFDQLLAELAELHVPDALEVACRPAMLNTMLRVDPLDSRVFSPSVDAHQLYEMDAMELARRVRLTMTPSTADSNVEAPYLAAMYGVTAEL